MEYSKEFYQQLANNLAEKVSAKTLIEVTTKTIAQLDQKKALAEKNKVHFGEVDALLKRMDQKADNKAVNDDDLKPLEQTTVKGMLIYDLSDLAIQAHLKPSEVHQWIVVEGITPDGYGVNSEGNLVSGYRKELISRLLKHAWEITTGNVK